MDSKCQSATLTSEEAAVYDRQIRLWGVEAQQRLRQANVLLVGLSGLGNEVCKNILLAGVKHLTILDETSLTEDDYNTQFFSTRNSIGKNKAEAAIPRAAELNPMVDIVADKESITKKTEDFYKQFDIVCLADCSAEVQLKTNEICHRLGIKFLCGHVFGYYGYMFSDLGVHKYMQEVAKKTENQEEASNAKKAKLQQNTDTEYVELSSTFCTLEEALNVPIFKGKSLRRAKQVSKTYLIMKVLLEFERCHGYFPKILKTNAELEKLLNVRDDVFDALNVDNDLLDEDFSSYCVGTLFPVCPIVGGVMAQEIIKAVSKKDVPHNNFFLYDGVMTSGVVECISNESHTQQLRKDIKPTIKDNQQSAVVVL